MEKSKSKNFLIILFALIMIVVGAFLLGGCGEEQKTIPIVPGTNEEVVQYLKDQLTQTQEQLTDANILLQSYLKQIEEANKNNATLSEQNQTLNSTIQSLQETVKSLNAEIQRLTALLEEYGKIAEGTWEVHFYDGESLVKLLLIRNNAKITETVSAEKEGFEFLGWANEPGGQVIDYQNIEITQQTNFYAVFERKTGLFNGQGEQIKSWNELVSQGDITLDGDKIIKDVNTTLSGKLIVPDSITNIQKNAFADCSQITQVDCFGVFYIGDYAFQNCFKLRAINYNSDSISFGIYPFMDCKNINSIVLPSSTNLGITKSVFLGDGLVEIINNSTLDRSDIVRAFDLDTYVVETLDGIHSGESRMKIVDGVEYYVYNDLTIAVGVADDRANIKLADDCDMVWKYAFYYNDQLRNVALNKNLTKIYVSAFSQCTGLESIWIPFNVIDSHKRSDAILVNSNSATLTVYFEVADFNSSAQSAINAFLNNQKTDSYPTVPSHYEHNVSREEYLQKIKL